MTYKLGNKENGNVHNNPNTIFVILRITSIINFEPEYHDTGPSLRLSIIHRSNDLVEIFVEPVTTVVGKLIHKTFVH